MKKTELINGDISALIARMGHTDGLAIGDCGLPVPDGVKRIDLALVRHIPTFLDTLKAVLSELAVEKLVLAEELLEGNPSLVREIEALLPGAEVEFVPHAVFKERTASAKAVIRTGECTPYANILLYAGVKF